jgi:hypothetical protein
MNTSRAKKYLVLLPLIVVAVLLFTIAGNLRNYAYAQDIPTETPVLGSVATETPYVEVISPYFSIEHRTLADGTSVLGEIINGPPNPPAEYEAERIASFRPTAPATILPNFPSFSWVFGCSAVSGAMITTYYDRGAYPNMYTGPTNGGVMPLTNDASWGSWFDGDETYPNNPLIASHNGVDGRGTLGSIDDYWVQYGSSASDPYITGGWPQHTWGTAIGDYMKTSQSAYSNTDGSTLFYTWTTNPGRLTCSDMVVNDIDDLDGTYGRKLFYEARGYTVGDCYNQKTDNNSGGFTLALFQAEIDAGNPVLLNLAGHSIVGYGYEGSTIYIRDTWVNDPSVIRTMTWGGSYSGMALLSVSVVHLVPPAAANKTYLPLVVKPSPPSVMFPNGDFEQGPVIWQEYSTHGWGLILQVYPNGLPEEIPPYDGTWAAWLGGDYDEISYIQQQITVPADRPYLSYYHWINSVDYCGYDFGGVLVNGVVVEAYDLCNDTNTGGWVKKVVNLSAYAGQSVAIQIRAECDSSYNSNLFIDQVAFQASNLGANQLPAVFIDSDARILKQDVLGK